MASETKTVSAVQRNTATPIRALHLWHLLSLDAPTVATLWTWFIAHTVGVRLPRAAPVAMFTAVWILYAADRLLDARQLFADPLHTDELEARHLFHHRHATAFLTAIAVAAVALASLLHDLLPKALELYTLLGALLFVWFLVIHARATPSAAHRRLPKELAVGLFFPAATFIPTVAHRPDLRLPLLPYAALFAAVCTLNCLAIYAWEHPDTSPTPNTAHWTTRYATRHLTIIATTTTLVALVLADLTPQTHLWPLALPVSLSAAMLLILHRRHRHIAPLTLRAASDLALLTPAILLWAVK